ncbi:phage terminase large subunit family protein [Escherichia coli]|uniref:phage terminase large subunit family protein n=1 Tax=Escherichia coli TaxID=562 RepID=UPI003D77BB86
MRVPKGAGNSVPWDPELTPYIIEPMNCLASREYDAVIFVGPARGGVSTLPALQRHYHGGEKA